MKIQIARECERWVKWLLPVCFFVFLPTSMTAQTVIEEDEEEEVVDEEAVEEEAVEEEVVDEEAVEEEVVDEEAVEEEAVEEKAVDEEAVEEEAVEEKAVEEEAVEEEAVDEEAVEEEAVEEEVVNEEAVDEEAVDEEAVEEEVVEEEAVEEEAVEEEAVEEEAVEEKAVEEEAVEEEAVDEEAVDEEAVDEEAVDEEAVDEEDNDETDEEVDETNAADEFTITDQEGNEEVIDFPEAMTYDLDSLMTLYMAKTYLDEDEDCQTTAEGPTYNREEYIERLRRLPTVMEMAYNDVVQQFIDRYSERLRHSVSVMLGASNFYMPIFEEALEAYDMPLELRYLPIIESALNPKAVSRVGATGLWQFMLATGRQYGLEVNSLVDERRDPTKASYAAARYLRDLYRVFGDWNLVIAAYNCGPANVDKAIHRAQAAAQKDSTINATVNTKDYWHIYPYLPKETRGYVPAFIAANYIMTYYSLHNICPLRTRLPQKTDTIVVSRDLHLAQVAGVLNLDIDMLRSLNPQYRRDIVPGHTKPSALKLPLTDVSRFIDFQDSIYAYNTAELLTKRSEVIINDNVPTFTKRKTTTRRKTARADTVRRGDTLSTIARRNGTTVDKLRKLNGIRGDAIRAGKRIRVR